jgi:hypothetical protein
MRTLDLNLEENRGELDFNFDNAIGGSLTSSYNPSSTNLQYRGSLYDTDSPLFGSTPKTDPKYNLGMNEETKSIMDRIRDFKIPIFNPNKTSIAPPAPQTAGMGTPKKSNLPIIIGGVVVVGVAMYFIFRK